MGSYNCIGFQSRLPIRPGDEIVLFLGLHSTPQLNGRFSFDPVEFAPGLSFTPIALPIMCKYDDSRRVRDVMRDGNIDAIERFFGKNIDDILLYCDYDDCNSTTQELETVVNEKLGLTNGDFRLTYTFDLRFVFEEISKMKSWWDFEKSYELTLELSDISVGEKIRKLPESSKKLLEVIEDLEDGPDKKLALELFEGKKKYYHTFLDLEFRKHSVGTFTNIGNLNPKYSGSSIFKDCESFRGSILISIYRYHADILFSPEMKNLFLQFLQFYQALRHNGWLMTLPIYGGQDDNLSDRLSLYRRMSEWVGSHNELD